MSNKRIRNFIAACCRVVDRMAVLGQTTATGVQKETFGTGSAAQSAVHSYCPLFTSSVKTATTHSIHLAFPLHVHELAQAS